MKDNIEASANTMDNSIKKLNVYDFKDKVSDIETVLNNFKNHLSAFEMIQVTNPNAYESLLELASCMINLAQILLENGVLKTDKEVEKDQELKEEIQTQKPVE